MRAYLLPVLTAGLFLNATANLRAQDEARAVVERAIKAHGGEEKLAKIKAVQIKGKGTINYEGEWAYTSEHLMQLPNRLKDVIQIEVMGQTVRVTNVYDGKKGWMRVGEETIELDKEVLEESEEECHIWRLERLVVLRDKTYELTPLGESKLNDRPVVGVKVTAKGRRDVNLYFDKDKGLLAKIEHRTKDDVSGQEVTEELIYQEYQEVDSVQVVKKLLVLHDGKKIADHEVLEVKFLDTVDDNAFAKP